MNTGTTRALNVTQQLQVQIVLQSGFTEFCRPDETGGNISGLQAEALQ
jgi:hypothetical protein